MPELDGFGVLEAARPARMPVVVFHDSVQPARLARI
jgi:hypothetical protein